MCRPNMLRGEKASAKAGAGLPQGGATGNVRKHPTKKRLLPAFPRITWRWTESMSFGAHSAVVMCRVLGASFNFFF